MRTGAAKPFEDPGRGRRAVVEVMVMNRAIAKLIQTEQTHQIPAQLQTGKEQGMQPMDMALLNAITAKLVDPDDAYRYATDRKKFERFVTDTTVLPSGMSATPAPAAGQAPGKSTGTDAG